jgi:uncharacterized integral membrane protein
MKGQQFFILGLVFAFIIAVFAVVNNNPVQVNYVFGNREWPLILVILGSALFGGLAAGLLSVVKIMQLKSQVRQLQKQARDKDGAKDPVPVAKEEETNLSQP